MRNKKEDIRFLLDVIKLDTCLSLHYQLCGKSCILYMGVIKTLLLNIYHPSLCASRKRAEKILKRKFSDSDIFEVLL
jgi:hypothetical protein